MKTLLLCACLLFALVCGQQTGTTVTVTKPNTNKGYVGTTDGVTDSFFGITYATYEKRWEKPVMESWPNKLTDAIYAGDVCPQPALFYNSTIGRSLRYKDNKMVISEDCLNLNIVRPTACRSSNSCKVVTFIHGGSFYVGMGAIFNQTQLAIDQNAIVVTINYRVGPFGGMPIMVEGKNQPNNLGYQDARRALQWVKKFAPYFGASDNVDDYTLMGLSAGAGSSMVQLILDDGDNEVFGKLLILSMTRTMDMPNQSAIPRENAAPHSMQTTAAVNLSIALNCQSSSNVDPVYISRKTLKCMQKASFNDIVRVWLPESTTYDNPPSNWPVSWTTTEATRAVQWGFGPVVDDKTIDGRFQDIVSNKIGNRKLKVLMTHVYNEGYTFAGVDWTSATVATVQQLRDALNWVTRFYNQDVMESMLACYGDRSNTTTVDPRCLPSLWPSGQRNVGTPLNAIDALVKMRGDASVVAQTQTAAYLLSELPNVDVYFAIETFPTRRAGGNHGSNICWWFDSNLFYDTTYGLRTPNELLYSKQLTTVMANFLQTGNPNGNVGYPDELSNTYWPKYNGNWRSIYQLGAATTSGTYHPNGCDQTTVPATGQLAYPCMQLVSESVAYDQHRTTFLFQNIY